MTQIEADISISNVKKVGQLYEVVATDGMPAHKLHHEIIAQYGITELSSFTHQAWETILDDNAFKLCYLKALDLLTRRLHSEYELRQKLKAKHFSTTTISLVIEQCKQLSFIDDQRFAELYFEELQGKGYGHNRVRQQLFRKKLPAALIDELCQKLDSDNELTAAQKAADIKLRLLSREKDPRKIREKLFRHLIGKGFQYETVSKIISDSL